MAGGRQIATDAISKIRSKDTWWCNTKGGAWRLDSGPVGVMSGDFTSLISVTD